MIQNESYVGDYAKDHLLYCGGMQYDMTYTKEKKAKFNWEQRVLSDVEYTEDSWTSLW